MPSHPQQKYHENRCKRRMEKRRERAQAHLADLDDPDRASLAACVKAYRKKYLPEDQQKGQGLARRGPQYEKFVGDGWPEMIVRGDKTQADVVAETGETAASVSRWVYAWLIDFEEDLAKDLWEIDAEVAAAVDGGYATFVRKFHPEMEVRDYDLEWEAHLDSVVGNGGQLLLLAAQRHGKTQFLSYYCQRRITEDPNIRILWVSRTADLASESLGFIRQLLEDEAYCEAVLGPGETFQPAARSGFSWTNREFTVAQRTKTMRAPTMRAIGIGQTISGRDADLIIIDDPQEREDIEDGATAGLKQRKWFFTTFLSRKMPHTGIAYITSRKHPDDIPGAIIEDHADDWTIASYQGHDVACTIPETDVDKHVDCVMWPSQRPFDHLMKLKRADELWFECNVQQNPTTDAITLLTAEHVADATNPRVNAGYFPPGWQLIAGFDPATAKENAAVLWAYHTKEGATQIVTAKKFPTGPLGLAKALEEWHDEFRCVEWVTETNLAGGFLQDTTVLATQEALGIRILGHYTDRHNKVDSSGGVTSMIQTIRHDNHPITFPTLDRGPHSEQVRQLVRQLLNYQPGGGKHADDDLVLAMWFPWWRKLRQIVAGKRNRGVMQVEYASVGNPFGGF